MSSSREYRGTSKKERELVYENEEESENENEPGETDTSISQFGDTKTQDGEEENEPRSRSGRDSLENGSTEEGIRNPDETGVDRIIEKANEDGDDDLSVDARSIENQEESNKEIKQMTRKEQRKK